MNPVTLRRLMVFGVCAVGVVCLYLTPDVTRAPDQRTLPRPVDEPAAKPSRAATASAGRTGGTARPVSATSAPTSAATVASPAERTEEPAPPRVPPRRPTTRGATAFDPADGTDDTPPAPVTGVSSAAVTPDQLSVHWPAAEDDVGVTGYRVTLNGYQVAATSLTHATVRWFNDDASANVVQVRALDAAGNESPASPPLLVTRPTPAPTPSDTPQPSSEPVPSTTPEPTPTSGPPEPGGDSAEISDPQPGQEPPVNQNTPSHEPAPAPGER